MDTGGSASRMGMPGRTVDQTGGLLYRKNQPPSEVKLGVSRHLPHEANQVHIHFDVQV
jgi:hypothetical protein